MVYICCYRLVTINFKMTEIEKYTVSLDNLDLTRIINSWTWLTGVKSVVALTKAGDMLLADSSDKLYFLNVGAGSIELVCQNYHDFFENKLDANITEEILLPNLVDELETRKTKLKPGQVYSFAMLPIYGGTYDVKNMGPVDLYEHYELTGTIHYKIKDLPDGTQIKITDE